MKITKAKLKEMIREELESLKEEVQSINEGLWSGIRTRETGVSALNGKKALQTAWGSGTSFQQILWRISPKKGHLSSDSTDADGKIKMRNYAPGWKGPSAAGLNRMYQHNKDAGLDIEKDFPFKDVNRMRKAYDRLPVETQVKMAHGDHKLAMQFLAKYKITPK